MVASGDTSGSAASSGAKPSPPDSSDVRSTEPAQQTSALRVDFYVLEAASAAARLKLACRLAEKAYLSGQTALIWHTDPEELKTFDELLWTFMDGSFVPHDMLGARTSASSVEPAGDAAPVLLSAGQVPAREFDILVNLAPDVPSCLSHTRRVAEIIDGEDSRRRAGRVRFKAYRELGVQPTTHNIRE